VRNKRRRQSKGKKKGKEKKKRRKRGKIQTWKFPERKIKDNL
jgi:hypothetical protein